jgi:predicted dehydrogenase
MTSIPLASDAKLPRFGLEDNRARHSRLRLAIVGCGAIAEQGHLPAASQVEGLEVSLLVDKDAERASKLARQFGVSKTVHGLDGIDGMVDAAVICLPHHLHCPVALDLMRRGLHVLVEKPMALNSVECDQMIAAAEKAQVVLAVGLMRRYFRCAIFLKQWLTSGVLGPVQRFHIQDGSVYSWSSASPFILSKAHSGGGVLMGNGSHVMDSLIWWFGEPQELECLTNAAGGMETDARVEMIMPGGARGTADLSRTRSLANSVKVWTERGFIEIPLYGDRFLLRLAANDLDMVGNVKAAVVEREQDLISVMRDQLRDLARAVAGQPTSIVSGEESRRSIALIESCYRAAKPLPEPWAPALRLT